MPTCFRLSPQHAGDCAMITGVPPLNLRNLQVTQPSRGGPAKSMPNAGNGSAGKSWRVYVQVLLCPRARVRFDASSVLAVVTIFAQMT